MEKNSEIKFANEKVKEAYLSLDDSFQNKKLKKQLDLAFSKLHKNAFCGIQIPKRLIPEYYENNFGMLDNLWKYNLPSGWRLIYTVKGGGVVILTIVLEWMSHKEYEKRFKY